MVINLERGMMFICYLYRRQRKRKKTANRFLREITKKKKMRKLKGKKNGVIKPC
jgi:preprotein translocase subunit YajC